MNENKKADFIKVDELYFGKVGQGIKNRFLRQIVDLIFSDRVRKRKFTYSSFSITFIDTEVEWYSNFMNGYFSKIAKVKCFFTKNDDHFIVYPVLGSPGTTSFYTIPKETASYIDQRKNEWQREGKKWVLDDSSVKKTQEEKQYRLEYRGEYKEKDTEYTVFEHTIFLGRDKIVFQAFVLKGSDEKVMRDLEKIAHSIVMHKR